MTAEVGSSVEFDALLTADGDQVKIGESLVGQHVTGTVVEHGRGPKIIVFKKKRRKQYKKTHGHRQNYTAVRIDDVGAASKEEYSEVGNEEKSEARSQNETESSSGSDS